MYWKGNVEYSAGGWNTSESKVVMRGEEENGVIDYSSYCNVLLVGLKRETGSVIRILEGESMKVREEIRLEFEVRYVRSHNELVLVQGSSVGRVYKYR